MQTVAIGSSTCSLSRLFFQQDSLRSWLVYLQLQRSHTLPTRYSTTGFKAPCFTGLRWACLTGFKAPRNTRFEGSILTFALGVAEQRPFEAKRVEEGRKVAKVSARSIEATVDLREPFVCLRHLKGSLTPKRKSNRSIELVKLVHSRR